MARVALGVPVEVHALFVAGVEEHRPVARADVVALPTLRRRVVDLEEELERSQGLSVDQGVEPLRRDNGEFGYDRGGAVAAVVPDLIPIVDRQHNGRVLTVA